MKSLEVFSLINSVVVRGDELRVSMAEELKPDVIRDDFFLKCEGCDLRLIPEEILLVPLLLNMAPVIWACGLKTKVARMDLSLWDALANLKAELRRMYPSLDWSGEILCDTVVQTEAHQGLPSDKAACSILFSGGLDSVATSFRHLGKKQLLVTVRGSDVSLDDSIGWRNVVEATKSYASLIHAECRFIESNFYDFLNHQHLNTLSSEIVNWWAYVQHGMGLSSMMAIPLWSVGAKTGYIASTHSTSFGDSPWGSTPGIDNKVAWGGVSIVHDGYELTRQGKIKYVAETVLPGGGRPNLRVCYTSRGGKNCCECEKCCRTMSGLVCCGVDFRDFGFPVSPEAFEKTVTSNFRRMRFKFDTNTLFHWLDIQNGIKQLSETQFNQLGEVERKYIRWLSEFDFVSYAKRQRAHTAFKKKVARYLKVIPGLFPSINYIRRLVQ